MGGHLRLSLIAAGSLAVFALAAPLPAWAGPGVNHGAAGKSESAHGAKAAGHGATPRQAPSILAAPSSAGADASPGAEEPAGQVRAPSTASERLSVPGETERAKPRDDQPAERADHASTRSQGRHLGAGDDRDGTGSIATGANAESSTNGGAPAEPSAGTQAASTPGGQRSSTGRPGGVSPPPSVIVEAPAAPQPRPPVGAAEVLTGARLDWILAGVVVALAAAVVAAVRLATRRGRRPTG
jgi:hypothetical protein